MLAAELEAQLAEGASLAEAESEQMFPIGAPIGPPPPPPPGAYQTTPQLRRGNLGERLATEALAALGHQILSYKPDITGTSRPGIDMVTFHNGRVWLVDNKALSRAGSIYHVSALTRNLARNLAQVRTDLGQMVNDPARPAAERQFLRQALDQLNAGQFVRAVTNANVARQNNVPTRLDPRLQRQGLVFLDLFRTPGNIHPTVAPATLAARRPLLARPLRLTRPSRLREMEFSRELESAAFAAENEAEPFYTRVQPVPHLPGYEEGHEVLTRFAASGVLAGPDLNALLLGVIRPDRGGVSYWNFPAAALHSFSPAAQRSHSLRRDPSTTQPAALSEIRNHLIALYSLSRSARDRATALGWVGEALHLIQDSYSGAHTQRNLGAGPGGTSPIQRIRAFYLGAWPPRRSTSPYEHGAPADPRDSVWKSRGKLRDEALFAVRASREYLLMLLRHLASPSAPGNVPEFRAFLNRHFSF